LIDSRILAIEIMEEGFEEMLEVCVCTLDERVWIEILI